MKSLKCWNHCNLVEEKFNLRLHPFQKANWKITIKLLCFWMDCRIGRDGHILGNWKFIYLCASKPLSQVLKMFWREREFLRLFPQNSSKFQLLLLIYFCELSFAWKLFYTFRQYFKNEQFSIFHQSIKCCSTVKDIESYSASSKTYRKEIKQKLLWTQFLLEHRRSISEDFQGTVLPNVISDGIDRKIKFDFCINFQFVRTYIENEKDTSQLSFYCLAWVGYPL